MPKSFIVAPLPPENIDQAFPVVQPLQPALTPAQWRAMAAPFMHPGTPRGIIACRMGTGHIRGLFCYALDGAGALRIGPFAVAGLFDAPATTAGLIEAIDQLAQRFKAQSVAVDLGAISAATVPRCDLPALFREHGYRRDGDALVRETVKTEQTMSMATA